MKKGLITLALCLSATSVAMAGPDLDKQRALFVKADQAAHNGDTKIYQRLAPQLKSYPLYPYLVYDDLEERLSDVSEAEIEQFFDQYNDIPASARLRAKWLRELDKKEQWHSFIKFYQPSKDVKLKCLYAKAKIKVGDNETANKLVKELWLTGYAQPDECDPAFAYGKKQGIITEDLIWQRYIYAVHNGQTSLASYLSRKLPAEKRSEAKAMMTVYRNPSLLTKQKFKDKKHSEDVVYLGMMRLAKRKSNVAQKAWHDTYQNYPFTAKHKSRIIDTISTSMMQKNNENAQAWFDKLEPAYLTWRIKEWQIRQNLRKQDWPKVQSTIETLGEKNRNKPIWRYWYARSLEQQGNAQDAHAIYQQLAKERNFYGFLAANQQQRPVPIRNKKLPISKADYNAVLNHPNIQRAFELYQHKRYDESNDEWWTAINKFNGQQRSIAARIADEFGWRRIALSTSARASHKEDLRLLYPMLYTVPVTLEAQENKLNPAVLYGMIRQESFFRHSAVSRAGARGLMQLMPATAKYVAKQMSFPYYGIEKLYDPATNIHLGSAYFQYLLGLFDNHPIVAIASYNAGPNRVKRWLEPKPQRVDLWVETIPLTETREYVKYVMTFALIYEYQLGKKPDMMPFLRSIPLRAEK